ncbi:MAG: hypothetical protein K0R31_386 [Clostridiales bacterium]|jgi:hypothetical protein|nr:hypothetical protein [Clostridiales bacterium]
MQTILLNIILKLQVLILGPASWLDGFFEGPAASNLESIFDTSEFKSPIGGLYLILNQDGTGTGTIYQSLWNTVQTLTTQTIMPVGVALVTTYFIMALIDMASKDNTTLEHYIKEFIKLIIAVTIVTKSWPIILYLLKISEFLLKDIGTRIGDFPLDATVDEVLNDNSSFGGYVALWFTSLLPWLVKKISVLALYVCVFMRVLDVTWRAALFPIGAANLFEGGISSPGVKYIKSFFGALLAGAMIMLILAISPPLLNSAYEMAGGQANVAAGMLAIAGAELAIVGAVFGASSKVKEVFS